MSLAATKASFGFLPNLQATMAESPELLAGYTALWNLFSKTTLTPHEQQVVYMTSNFENECHYCMAGHTGLAKMQKMDASVIDALRNGTPIPDRKLEALHRFATLVVRNRGWVSDADVDAFLAAGYTRRNVLEVILGVATKVMSNYTNHVAHTRLDTMFLEEAGLDYAIHPVDISAGDQFKPEFLAFSPNNRMPGIIDPTSVFLCDQYRGQLR